MNQQSSSTPTEKKAISVALSNSLDFVRRIDRRLMPLVILALSALIIAALFATKPSAKKRPPEFRPQLYVDVMEVNRADYQVKIESYGTIQPRTQSFLVAQVGGMVTAIADNFRDGAFFNQGDVLLTIDDRDYRADVNIAEASLADAQQSYEEQLARSEQARLDWDRLDQPGEPSDLVLRKPQLLAAKARVDAARSSLNKAKLSLQRTNIIAPFDGRIIKSSVDIGQVVGMNTPLTEVYSTDYVEIRLPLKDVDLPYIDLPEQHRGASTELENLPEVKFTSGFSSRDQWPGNIVRVESTIDSSSRQLHVVAQIEDPFASETTAMIKIGQYVTAEIQGRSVDNAIVIPNNAIYQNTFVYVVDKTSNSLQRKDIEIGWQNGSESLVIAGIEIGDTLVTTPLGQVVSGTRVAINGSAGSTQRDKIKRNAAAAEQLGKDQTP